MTIDQLSNEEASAFGERLDAFGEELSSKEQVFLKIILCNAEAAPDDGSRSFDVDSRTFGDIVIAIHRAHLSPVISLNPLPIRALPRSTDAQRGRE